MSGHGDDEWSNEREYAEEEEEVEEEEDSEEDDSQEEPSETDLVRRTFANHRGSVVRILAQAGQELSLGTGFVVRGDGAACLVLTCHHVVEGLGPDDVAMVNFDGMADDVPAKVVRFSQNRDLALLSIVGAPATHSAPLVLSDEVNLSGRDVVTIGFFGVDSETMLVDPSASFGRIMSEPAVQQEEPDLLEFIIVNFTTECGMSGGPVILDDEVIGLTAQKNIGTTRAITAATVKSALKEWTAHVGDDNISFLEMLDEIAAGI